MWTNLVFFFLPLLSKGIKFLMVRIAKLTDYALVILAHMAREGDRLFNAREIASHTHIAQPTVSKLLKNLAKKEFLLSERGALGGYRLKKSPETITVVDLIETLEGPIAITECNLGDAACPTQAKCSIRTPWLHINQVLTEALSTIKLSDLIKPSHIKGAFHGQ
jgi:FeS assembly SUF system regulator